MDCERRVQAPKGERFLRFRRPARNLDLMRFNTIRLGDQSPKYKVGDTVHLVRTDSDMYVGRAKIVHIEVGDILQMLCQHARFNHNYFDCDPGTAPDEMYMGMLKRYGPKTMCKNHTCTVIYLKRLAT
jgi:hypothetical protein